MKYLLDTCVVSELVRPRPSPRVVQWIGEQAEEDLALSVLCLGELLKGIAKLPESSRKRQLHDWVESDLAQRFQRRILPVSVAVATRWGRIQGEAEAAGNRIPAIDSLLGATAIVHDLVVVTRNTADLARTCARLLNPWK